IAMNIPTKSEIGKLLAEGHHPKAEARNRIRHQAFAGFTLIELLIVIAIIAIPAAMVIPISGAVNRNKIRAKARVELEQVATAIELYKSKLGHYPPDNPGNPWTN